MRTGLSSPCLMQVADERLVNLEGIETGIAFPGNSGWNSQCRKSSSDRRTPISSSSAHRFGCQLKAVPSACPHRSSSNNPGGSPLACKALATVYGKSGWQELNHRDVDADHQFCSPRASHSRSCRQAVFNTQSGQLDDQPTSAAGMKRTGEMVPCSGSIQRNRGLPPPTICWLSTTATFGW